MIFGFAGKRFISAWIDQRARQQAESQLELLRSDLRRVEEDLKSRLRDAEAEAAGLRSYALSGRAQRQGLVDKRRLEAADNLWRALTELYEFRGLATWMAQVDILMLHQSARMQPDAGAMVHNVAKGATIEKFREVAKIRAEQPFVTPLAWGYFMAYQAIGFHYFSLARVFGLPNVQLEQFMDYSEIKRLLRAALPNYSDAIDQANHHSVPQFLDILEGVLLEELRRGLEDTSIDETRIQQAAVLQTLSKAVLAHQPQIEGDKLVATATADQLLPTPTPNAPPPAA